MYYVLYDKDLKALGTRKSYQVSEWTLTRKAFEFSTLKIKGMPIDNADGAMYVALQENTGEIKYVAMAGLPVTKDGVTEINAVDIRQLLNNDAVIDLTAITPTVQALYVYLLGVLFTENVYGGVCTLGVSAIIDTTEITGSAAPAWNADALEATRAVGNVWDTIQSVNAVYDCVVEASLSFADKTVTFKVRQIANEVRIKLEDFHVNKIKNDYTGLNRAVCVNDLYVENGPGAGAYRAVYYLLSDDTVYEESVVMASETLKAGVIYPPHIQTFQEASIDDAVAAGLKELYKARFQASVEIDLDTELGYILADLDFTYQARIYGFNSSDNSVYKILPVMQIFENDKKKKKVTFGRLEDYYWL